MFEDFTLSVGTPACSPNSELVGATVSFETDISELIPYVNGFVGTGYFYPDLPYLRFGHAGHTVVLYPHRLLISGLKDRVEAREVAESVFELLRDVAERQENGDLEPCFESRGAVPALNIFRLLPRLNCGDCGVPTCMAFAAQVSQWECTLDDCPKLHEEAWADNREQLDELLHS